MRDLSTSALGVTLWLLAQGGIAGGAPEDVPSRDGPGLEADPKAGIHERVAASGAEPQKGDRPAVRARSGIRWSDQGAEAPGGQGARRANTAEYSTDEQRSPAGWIGGEGEQVISRRALSPAAKRPAPRRQVRPRTLETDPIDLLPMAPGRAVYLWPASPRLRTGAWIAVHYFMEKPRTIRRYDPEFLYQKADSYFVTQVGGALRLGPVEVSVSVPFAGLVMAEFYEKGVVDHVFRELDRADMNMAVKYGFRIRRGRDLWLVTPYVALTAPTQKRDSYEINLGGHLLWHHTAPPRSMSLLPGLATGWRRDMWSAVISIGCLVTMPLERDSDLDESEPPQELQVGLMSAYQLGFAPFRDLGFSLALLHLRELSGPAKEQEDRFWAAFGVRMQPYAGLYGHLGFMVPLERISRDSPSLMVTLQAGWEFR